MAWGTRLTFLLVWLFLLTGVAASQSQCHQEIEIVWRRELDGILAGMTVCDLDGDGDLEVGYTLAEHTAGLLSGLDGSDMPGWPLFFPASSFMAAPVFQERTYVSRLLFATAEGDIVLAGPTARLQARGLRAPPLAVPRDWYAGLDLANATVAMFLSESPEARALAKAAAQAREKLAASEPASASDSASESEGTDPRLEEQLRELETYLTPAGIASLRLFLQPGAAAGMQRDPLASLSFPSNMTERAGASDKAAWVLVDAHVLGTPVASDLEGDGYADLVVPVSYVYDVAERQKLAHSRVEADKYVGGGVAVFDLRSLTLRWERHFEVSTDTQTDARAYVTAPPLVADLDNDGRREVVVATQLGMVYVLRGDSGEPVRWGQWPATLASGGGVHAALVGEDVDGDGFLEVLVADLAGGLTCFTRLGTVLWEQRFQGALLGPPTLADIDDDGALDVVIATSQGQLWALRADVGSPLSNFPVQLYGHATAQVLPLRCGGEGQAPLLIVGTDAGVLHVVDGSGLCVERLEFGAAIDRVVLAGDVSGQGNLELLVGTRSALYLVSLLLCTHAPMREWHSFNQGANVLTAREEWHGVFWDASTREHREVQTASFPVSFTIVDQRWAQRKAAPPVHERYNVSIFIAGEQVWEETVTGAGSHTAWIPSPNVPRSSSLRVVMHNAYAQRYEDMIGVSFHTRTPRMLKWVVLAPMVAMTLALLFRKTILSELEGDLPTASSASVSANANVKRS